MTTHRTWIVAVALAATATTTTAQEVTRLTASGPSDIWALTDQPSVVHFDGRQWTNTPVTASGTILDLWASGPRDAWIVGEAGTLLHYNGSAWQAMASPVRKDLVRVNGCSASMVYVLAQSEHDGDPSILLRWDGRAWTQTPITPPFRVSDLYLVCGAGAGGAEVAVAGVAHFDPVPTVSRSAGVIARLRGGAWTTTGFDGQRATVPALADLGIERYCAGAGGTHAAIRRNDGSPALLRQSGTSWSVLAPPELPPGSDIVDATWVLARDCTPLVVFNQGIARLVAGQWHVVAPGVAAQAQMQTEQQRAQQMMQGLNLQPGQMPTPEQMRQIQAIAMAQAAHQEQSQQTMQAVMGSQVWNFGIHAAAWAPTGADFYVSSRDGRFVHVVGDSAVTIGDLVCAQQAAASLPQCQALQQPAPARTAIPQPSRPAAKPRP
jgi:hypothetical protein